MRYQRKQAGEYRPEAIQQRVAALSNAAVLLVAGYPIALKGDSVPGGPSGPDDG